ncbi:ATP-binding protein [uncultured Faecalibaculum sp.]|uniref:ATP-binding protein n=1 Tax=uncultured Faecalibaculum sp. TaxID=1729681 RepID=UPI0026235005|nr:AAA family ATPase [uncultured Faecalibaculum sp.]
MLKRRLYQDLLDWKNRRASSKALFIMGARQVGKSTLARHFGAENYESVIEINFYNDPGASRIFRQQTAQTVLTQLTAYTGQSIIPGKTLIILDEIQECPAARTAVKFLVEEGSAQYIETGSLLGIQYKPVKSLPVGYEEQINMYPMDFEEFLWALNYPLESIQYLKDCFLHRQSVGEAVHDRMLRLFETYIVVGGMPEAVQTYVRTRDITETVYIQKQILTLYRQDISKYAQGLMSLKIRQIFDSIPSQLDDKNRRFRLNALGKGAQMRNLENAFLWLEEAGVALPCYNTSAPVTPLRLNEKRNLFKLFMNDTGLLCAASLGNIQFALLQGELDINSGSILENAFAQALASKGLDLFYYDSKTIGELDFVIQNERYIDVLEIKSGNDYRKHRALDKALQVSDWNFHEKIVFCKADVQEEDDILYLPFYMIMFYALKDQQHLIWDPLAPDFN